MMKTWVIIKRSDLSLVASYQSDEMKGTTADRSWLQCEPICMHLELPANLELDEIKIEEVEGQVVISHDPLKEAAKLAAAWNQLRSKRDGLLWESDKYMLPDYPISAEKKAEIVSYRNALRDFPSQVADPRLEQEWPVLPEI